MRRLLAQASLKFVLQAACDLLQRRSRAFPANRQKNAARSDMRATSVSCGCTACPPAHSATRGGLFLANYLSSRSTPSQIQTQQLAGTCKNKCWSACFTPQNNPVAREPDLALGNVLGVPVEHPCLCRNIKQRYGHPRLFRGRLQTPRCEVLHDLVSIKLGLLDASPNCSRLATRSFPSKAKYTKNQQNPTWVTDGPLLLDTPTPTCSARALALPSEAHLQWCAKS